MMKNVAGYDVSRLLAGSMGTLGVILELSFKVLPRPARELTLVFECEQDEAIRRVNRWSARPLPLSAASWCDGRLSLRLSGARSQTEKAAEQLAADELTENQEHWRQLREHELEFFAGDGPLWRLSLPPACPALDLDGDCLLDWGGAQRWYSTTESLGPDPRGSRSGRWTRHAVSRRVRDRSLPPAAASHGATAEAGETGFRSARPVQPFPHESRLVVQTRLDQSLQDTPEGREADAILRSCVHCGFCNATCPTYQLLGDERDGPRGRIYLIKEMLEHNTATRETQVHLDRCLTCRSCETTCPSGVQYNRLLEIGRGLVERLVPRPPVERLQRKALLATVPDPARFKPLLQLGNLARPALPAALKKSLPRVARCHDDWPGNAHPRKVLLLEGCVQSVTHPEINLAAAKVLDRLGVQALPASGCCGALSHHMSAEKKTLETARRNIDNWWPMLADGAEAILLTASGCAPTVGDYGRLLKNDPAYAEKAGTLASLAMDISEFMEKQDLSALNI